MDNQEAPSVVVESSEGANRTRDLCQICLRETFKYKCPACETKTCSLSCCRTHKDRLPCTGIRDRTAFVDVQSFSDQHLMSDFHFLQDAERCVENAVRTPKNSTLATCARLLQKAARQRGTNLRIMPAFFSKRKENTSMYHIKDKVIYWRVEWIFPACNAKIVDSKVEETQTWKDLLSSHLRPKLGNAPVRQKIHAYSSYSQPDSIRLYLPVPSTKANAPRYYRISLEDSIRHSLAGKHLIEFPSIHVALPENDEFEALLFNPRVDKPFFILQQERRRAQKETNTHAKPRTNSNTNAHGSDHSQKDTATVSNELNGDNHNPKKPDQSKENEIDVNFDETEINAAESLQKNHKLGPGSENQGVEQDKGQSDDEELPLDDLDLIAHQEDQDDQDDLEDQDEDEHLLDLQQTDDRISLPTAQDVVPRLDGLTAQQLLSAILSDAQATGISEVL
eukprot:TRINITY_DN7708_c0_g1_i1.p1 TRINITY_DN7708_c0_g1~~TRINITY_DN7708_c0_g1_i1.p1  ORF type:complete len:450 (-),score=92.86 TRINITY_DN7708_c0_g1_i1:229-1578(-)